MLVTGKLQVSSLYSRAKSPTGPHDLGPSGVRPTGQGLGRHLAPITYDVIATDLL